jgi:hypothetical protein
MPTAPGDCYAYADGRGTVQIEQLSGSVDCASDSLLRRLVFDQRDGTST